jgi:predicted RNase H-like HicB family nuclease
MRESFLVVKYEGAGPKIALVLTREFQQEDDCWLAECLELGSATYSSTLAEAREELTEAVVLQLSEVEELGFLEDFLRDRRVQSLAISPRPAKPHGVSSWAAPTAVGV